MNSTEFMDNLVTVTLSKEPETRVEFLIWPDNNFGATRDDYVLGNNENERLAAVNVSFDTDETSKTFTITATDDNTAEEPEQFQLFFFDPLPMGVTTGSHTTATVTITDE